MHDCIFKLLRAGDEESLECMCMLLFTIGKDLDSHRGKVFHFMYMVGIDCWN
jgi:translation initiation factor 4G